MREIPPTTRRSERQGEASAVLGESSFPAKGNVGNEEEAPASQGCRREKPRLCCTQVKKQNGSTILSPKKGKLKINLRTTE